MSTLDLIWDAQTRYKLWSWTNGGVHYVARVIRRLHAHPHICTARLGDGTHVPIPRSNTDEGAEVAVVKTAGSPEGAVALEREAQFYAQLEAAGVQGRAAPRCIGHFRGREGGSETACLVLEYCAGTPGEEMHDVGRKIMAAAYALHGAGVMHGDLLDGHHFVKRGRRMVIVDFSAAVQHECVHGREVRGSDGRRQIGVCPELGALERLYGVYR
ncbi:hypothetical protein DFH07DRAFT_897660 [Mycena maculata]|uniref:Protein kinase domain-containing protein n=1 Tax=Mycena maculata TaxID=230809 RepID=A0AAD7MLN9_9AGAR|nr:hypothetical protein DFH07DRAFT_897660 [Mycena maculata]